MALDPELIRHKEWLGFLQPVGLVVSPPALMAAQAVVNRNVVSLQQRLLDVISSEVGIRDFQEFAIAVLDCKTQWFTGLQASF